MAGSQEKVYELTITIDLPEDVPSVWRKLQIRGEASLAELSRAIQESFGWSGIHKHEFVAEDKNWKATSPQYGPPEFDDTYKSEEELTVQEVGPSEGAEYSWNYDMMDAWVHKIKVVSVKEGKSTELQTKLLDGARAGIPEDVGGASGFQEFLQSLDPSDPEHNAMAAWYKTDCPNGSGKYDVEAIEFDKINHKLAAWTPES